MADEKSVATEKGPTSDGSSTATQTFDNAVPSSFLETYEKHIANPTDETLKKSFEETLGKAKADTLAKAEFVKKAEEAAKTAVPPDYKKMTLPEGSKLSAKHLESVQKLAEAAKWPLETAKTVLARDNEIINSHLEGVAADFKKYSEDGRKTLEKDWGEKYKENVGKANQVVAFYEKQMPGLKAEIDRMGLNDSVTANKFFQRLFTDLKMAPDVMEHAGSSSSKGSPMERTDEQKARALFPNAMAGKK